MVLVKNTTFLISNDLLYLRDVRMFYKIGLLISKLLRLLITKNYVDNKVLLKNIC